MCQQFNTKSLAQTYSKNLAGFIPNRHSFAKTMRNWSIIRWFYIKPVFFLQNNKKRKVNWLVCFSLFLNCFGKRIPIWYKNSELYTDFALFITTWWCCFTMYQKSYTEIDYDQFQLILKIAHSLFLRTFVPTFRS